MARKKNGIYLTKTLRNEIRALIAEKYQSLDEFERATGVPKSTLSRIITGERNDCMLSTLGLIAKGLKKNLVIRFE
jgi:predicted transcriptional regulator